ncbi:hypothetical protein B0H13DRAFT_2020027 [Mycena leptocephala]|nr:hypothetical protein B0H13DRAFT_2020027 [Mycena leptocephala]
MSAAALSDELWRQALVNCPRSTLITVPLVCKRFSTHIDRILYHKVNVNFRQALLFFRTLRGRPALGGNVRYLHLQRAEFCIDGAAFEAALASLTGVRNLHILCPIDVKAFVQHFRAPLLSFTYGLPVCDTVYQFLVQQPSITAISLYHPLHRDPTPTFLPALEKVEALSEDLADLIVGAPVQHIVFRYRSEEWVTQPVVPPQFFALSNAVIVRVECMACQLVDQAELDLHLPNLETLVVTQDVTWGDRQASDEYPQLAIGLARKLTRLQKLELLIVVTELRSLHATIFCQALRDYCQAPQLLKFVFHSGTKCLRWADFRVSNSIPTERPLSTCTTH